LQAPLWTGAVADHQRTCQGKERHLRAVDY
jgi:hypothetical protein